MSDEEGQMSDEELSLKIAAFLGWKFEDRGSSTQYRHTLWYGPDGDGDVNPPDFVTDPELTVMLLTTKTKWGFIDMIDDYCAVGFWSSPPGAEWLVRVDVDNDRSEIGRAVAEAFARANNLWEEE